MAVGAGAGVAVRRVSARLAASEELDSSGSALVRLGYPGLMAAAFGLFAAEHWSDPWTLLLDSLWIVVLVQVVFFDLEHGLILDRVVLPAAAVALVVSLFQ